MKFFIILLCLTLQIVFSKWENEYVIMMYDKKKNKSLETSPFPFTKMNLSDRQKLCKSVRNAQIFVDFNKWEKFPKWMTYVFPQIKGDNRRIHHYTTENDGHIFFFHQQFKNTELLRCDYGVSEIYLTEIVNPGNFYMLYWKGSDSEMLSNMASVVHILKSLPCNKNKSVDDLTIFQNTFQERVQGLEPVQISSRTIYLPTEDSLLNEAPEYILPNRKEKRILTLPLSKKLLLCATMVKYLSGVNEIKIGKSLYLSVSPRYTMKSFPFLHGIEVPVLQCFGRSTQNESFIELFIVPDPVRFSSVFAVYPIYTNGEIILSVKQFFIDKLFSID